MMNMKMIPVALLAGLMMAPAFAQDDAAEPANRYASASSLNWEINNGDAGKGSGLRLVYGMPLTDHLALELHGGLGGGSTVAGVDTELKELLGGYLRAQVPLTDMLSVFARYGYTRAKFELDDGMSAETETETGGSYGGGVAMKVLSGVLDGGLSLTLDYMMYLDKSGGEFDARSVGLRLEF